MILQFNETSGNAQLESLSSVLGEMVSHSEIDRLFQVCGLRDNSNVKPAKWKRIFSAFAQELASRDDKRIIYFIENIFDLTNFGNNLETFKEKQKQLNKVLCFIGAELNDEGKMISITKVKTIDEATKRYDNLLNELKCRNIHPLVMKYCSKEYLVKDYFHAGFEAVKGLYDHLRELTYLNFDGNTLVDNIFSKDKPLIVINPMKTQTDIDEFLGLKYLILYLHKSVRNLDAHITRLNNEVQLDRILDIFVCVSLAYKYLDTAQTTCFVQPKISNFD